MVEREYPEGKLTELELSRRRRASSVLPIRAVSTSFSTIVGWNASGAIVHYEPTEESSAAIVGDGLLLVWTPEASTSTAPPTSPAPLHSAQPTAGQRHDFTLVMKDTSPFPTPSSRRGTTGHQLDALARQFLWKRESLLPRHRTRRRFLHQLPRRTPRTSASTSTPHRWSQE